MWRFVMSTCVCWEEDVWQSWPQDELSTARVTESTDTLTRTVCQSPSLRLAAFPAERFCLSLYATWTLSLSRNTRNLLPGSTASKPWFRVVLNWNESSNICFSRVKFINEEPLKPSVVILSQSIPPKPGAHVQVKLLFSLLQVPLLRQGLGVQEDILCSQNLPV